MSEHRYILQKYTGRDSRFECPYCKKPNQFSKYIDSETGNPVGDNVGICNRVDKCGYHYTPKQYFDNNGIKPESVGISTPKPKPVPQPISFIDDETFNNSLIGYENNKLIDYLNTIIEPEIVNQLISIYKIGTSSRYNGGTTVFWQVDASDNVRTGKLIKYDNAGHRIKGCNNWVHSVLNIDNFNLQQCFFGEHLLKHSEGERVGIVESEKTAIIASIYFPELVWLASGGAYGINKEKVKVLKGRKVILFPDASKDGKIYKKWEEKAKQFGFEISDYLEQYANDDQKINGVDIADFLAIEKKAESIIEAEPTIIEQEPIKDSYGSKDIPYNEPSPVAIIDSKIENPPKFEGVDLVVQNRVFTSINGDKIELVGIHDYGFCGNWDNHKLAEGYCKPCLLNCLHTLKINGKLQKKEYTQLEVLMLIQNTVNN